MEEEILRIALENAIKYNGKASVQAVIGQAFSKVKFENREDLFKKVREVVDYVNSLDFIKQKEMFGAEIKKVKVERVREIPDLVNFEKKVVMRFAPNPGGTLSFGHARPALWNWFFVQKYGGLFLLRFDDTDPKIKVPIKEAYKWIVDDLKWLGVRLDKVIYQSKRLKTYYKYAEKLIYMNKAYVCTCDKEKWKKLILKKLACKCRELSSEEQIKRWKNMFTKFKDGEAIYRVKTDLEDPNPAVRDWPGFRIISKSKHPLDKKSRVWPLLNFASAIDDREFEITHILRGIDLKVSDVRQGYLYKYFNWKYPETIYTGKLIIKGTKSKSTTRKLIQEGKLSGWDDPRLGTLISFRKRGYKPEAIIKFIKEIGIGKSDIHVSVDSLNSVNRKIIDPESGRYFFVKDPKKMVIKNAPKLKTKVYINSDSNEGSFRIFKTHNKFYIQDKLEKNQAYRLIHLFNFMNNNFISKNYDANLKTKMLHWIPYDEHVKVEIIMDNGEIVKGLGEKSLRRLKSGASVQFVRFGYCVLSAKKKSKLEFNYIHN